MSSPGRPVGFKESAETRAKKSAAMKDRHAQKRQPMPEWSPTFKAFGDRLDFLSPETQHVTTGRLRILPAKERPPRG